MKTLFPLGRLLMTPGVRAAVPMERIEACLVRHVGGDFGVCDAEDQATNRAAVANGSRILSAYPIDPAQPCAGYGENTFWIITDADRGATTALLPDEY